MKLYVVYYRECNITKMHTRYFFFQKHANKFKDKVLSRWKYDEAAIHTKYIHSYVTIHGQIVTFYRVTNGANMFTNDSDIKYRSKVPIMIDSSSDGVWHLPLGYGKVTRTNRGLFFCARIRQSNICNRSVLRCIAESGGGLGCSYSGVTYEYDASSCSKMITAANLNYVYFTPVLSLPNHTFKVI